MPYVMIPVPEEHVEDVMQFTLRAIAQAEIEPWDTESITQTYGDVDEATRSLLAFVARASFDGEALAAADAARQIQLTVREAVGISNELSILTREAKRPSLIVARNVPERLPNGRVTEKRVFQMDPEVAELIQAAEQAELRSQPDPLAGATE